MNAKIESYIDSLFHGVPRTRAARELRDELVDNMHERYQDYLREGKSEAEAYRLTVASMGDIDEIIAQVMPDETFRQEAQRYRLRKARNTAVAVALYILGAALLIGSGMYQSETVAIKALVGLLILAAVATALIVYTNLSTPAEFKDESDDDRWERELRRRPGGERFRAMMSIFWSAVTAVYLLVSFLTMAWHLTWLIWPVAGILAGIFRVVFLMRDEQ